MHEYIAQPRASGGLAGASNTLQSNQPTANSANRLTHRNPDTPTLAEIRYGIEVVGDPIRRAELNDWLAHKVRPMFDQRVLEVATDSIELDF